MKPTEIQESYTVNGKTFNNRHDAEKYRDELDAKNFDNYPVSSFDEIVYYEIHTHHGDRDGYTRCNGTFTNATDAYKEMQNHSNDWRPNSTGWMDQVTIKKENDKTVTINRKTIYEND